MKKEARPVKVILIGEKIEENLVSYIDFELVAGSGKQDIKSVYFFPSKTTHTRLNSNIYSRVQNST